MAKKNINLNLKLSWVWISLLVISIICLVVYIVINNTPNKHKDKDVDNKVCLSLPEYQKLLLQKSQPQQPLIIQQPIQQPPQQSSTRDYRVLNDQLYPPLNRTDAQTHTAFTANIENRNMYVPTRDIKDNYRLVGYVINNTDNEKDAGGNKWKLIAREKDRNTADFYMIPSDSRYDIKVAITDNIVTNGRLRDIYTIPNSITFNSPLLNKTPYEFVEIPKTDYTSSYT